MFKNDIFGSVKSTLSLVMEKFSSSNKSADLERTEEIGSENGYVLSADDSNYYIPEEILALILSYVDLEDLKQNCRLVCHSWKTVIENFSLKLKAERECAGSLKKGILNGDRKVTLLPGYLYYWILKKNIFGRNLLKNNCGQERLRNHWKILSNGGDKFVIEDPPAGADPLPSHDDFGGYTSCFSTSYHSNSKSQLIDLSKEGLISTIMDDYQPVIRVSEWFTGRFDCGCIYELKVSLLDKNRKIIKDFERREGIEQWAGGPWHLVQHEFSNYGPGVRYIEFYHGGMDTQFWAGHYGSKMSGGVVKALFVPKSENSS